MYCNNIFCGSFAKAVSIGGHIIIACEAYLPVGSTLDDVGCMVGWAESRKTWHLVLSAILELDLHYKHFLQGGLIL